MSTETETAVEEKGLMPRPYKGKQFLESQKEDEPEVQVTEETSEETEDKDLPEAKNAEDAAFKKRYADLRRYQQQQARESKEKIDKLERELSKAKKGELKLPKSEDELKEFASKHPDVAATIRAFAIQEARKLVGDLEKDRESIEDMRRQTARERAEQELMKLHPDFDEIRMDEKFHEWVGEQPRWVQEALYENDTDARAAARAIDLYKADMGLNKPKRDKKEDSKAAAKSVNVKGETTTPKDKAEPEWSESRVNKLSAHEWDKYEDEIQKAIRSGNFLYDISGAAR